MYWILVVILYVFIGAGIMLYILKTDKYGGFVLHVWWVVVLFYPYLIIRSLMQR